MASYEVKGRKVGCYSKALAANTVDSVKFASEPPSIRVSNYDVAAKIYVTVDGSNPTVGGEATYEVPPGLAATVDVPNSSSRGAVTVKLISAGTPIYSVSRVAG